MKIRLLIVLMLVLSSVTVFAQNFKFAFLSDIHIGVKNADVDLMRTVADIDADTSLKFVILTGDITENSFDEENWKAKNILSKLTVPLYMVSGNHDSYWSPNGGRIFTHVFGSGRFLFQYGGFLFIGTNAGPGMQHKAPGQVPKEDLVWLDSVLNNLKDPNIPIVYANHYPQDEAQRNSYEVLNRLDKKNIQLYLVGHGHQNRQYAFDGVPGVMGRTNMRGTDSSSGYNIVTIADGKATFEERRPLSRTQKKWAEATLVAHHFSTDTTHYPRPSFVLNAAYPNVKRLWQHEEKYDIGAGTALANNVAIATSNEGSIYALNKKDGAKVWSFKTNGKIYSTPAVAANQVIAACTDSMIYCLNVLNGKLAWKYNTQKPIVASPVIKGELVLIGSSDGHFRAINLKSGKLKWDFTDVKDFVMTKPLVYGDKVYFGSWGNRFYAINISTGKLVWVWEDSSSIRMNSPAGCRPVATKGKVFIVAPDQFMTAFDAETGKVIWRRKMPEIKVRESIGLSADSTTVFVKTTDGKLYGFSTTDDSMKPTFNIDLKLYNDMCAAPIIENRGVVFVPSNSGVVSVVDSKSRKLLWQHKVGNSMINCVMPIGDNRLIVSSVEGTVTCLEF